MTSIHFRYNERATEKARIQNTIAWINTELHMPHPDRELKKLRNRKQELEQRLAVVNRDMENLDERIRDGEARRMGGVDTAPQG